MKPFGLLFLFLICFSTAYNQPERILQSTKGDYSPSVYAKSTSVNYGLHPRIVDELLAIFEQNGLVVLEQQAQVESLLKAYQLLPQAEKADQELSDAALESLKIAGDSTLSQIMQWAVFTQGNYSPAVFALGDVDIWYGLSASAFKGLYKVFMDKRGDLLIQEGKLNEFEQMLAAQIEKYNQLRKELSTREDEMAREAQYLLDEGKVEEALEVLKNRYYFEKAQDKREQEETAEAAYDYAQALELDLKFQKATKLFREAVVLAPENSEYLLVLANNLHELGHYDEAIPLLQRSITLDSLTFGDIIHENLAVRYNNLGSAYDSKGSYDKAIGYYERALSIDLLVYGEDHPNVAIRYNNLGLAYASKGSYDKAIGYFERALSIDLLVYGEDHPNVAISYNNLGGTYDLKGSYDKAIGYYEHSLSINLLVYGEDHPNVAICYNNLGSVYDLRGSYDKAIDYYERSLSIDLLVYGEDHPNVAIRYNNLGLVYASKGSYDKAIDHYERSLSIALSVFGEQHPQIAICYNNLGMAYASKGSYDKAIGYYERALPIDLSVFGEQHPQIAICYNNLGLAYASKGSYDKAIGYYERALSITSSVHKEQHPQVATYYNNLGGAYSEKGSYDKAIGYYERSLSIALSIHGEQHPQVATYYNNLGGAYASKGSYDKAISYYEKTLVILDQFLPPIHPYFKITKENLSRAYNSHGMQYYQKSKYLQAQGLFQKAFDLSRAIQDSSFMLTCLNNVGSSLKHLGKCDSALLYLNEGIRYGDSLQAAILTLVETFPDSIRHDPNFPIYLRENSYEAVLERLYLHRAGCLHRLGQKQEALQIFNRLKQAARNREDQKLLEEIEQEGF